MRRLNTLTLAAMLVAAITAAAWPTNAKPAQSVSETAQSVTETPETVNEPPVFVNDETETVINTAEIPTATAQPEPEYYDETTDPTFTGYPARKDDSEDEITRLAKTVYGEAGICSTDEQRLVIWTVLQRVDDERFPDTIAEVITAANQFAGYHAENPADEDILALCRQEVGDWSHGAEPPTLEPYADAAPYFYFDGDGRHNWFREVWQ
jgi:hypothetical protein